MRLAKLARALLGALLLAGGVALALTGCSGEPGDAEMRRLGEEVGVVEIETTEVEPTVAVPNVVGLPTHDAAKALEAEGLGSPALTEVPSSEPTGTVIGQNPQGGARLPAGSVVELYFSRGQAPEDG
jgi:beta-lactam-binding protein with PASTA domain